METVVLNLETVNLTDEQFYHLCQANQTLVLRQFFVYQMEEIVLLMLLG